MAEMAEIFSFSQRWFFIFHRTNGQRFRGSQTHKSQLFKIVTTKWFVIFLERIYEERLFEVC